MILGLKWINSNHKKIYSQNADKIIQCLFKNTLKLKK